MLQLYHLFFLAPRIIARPGALLSALLTINWSFAKTSNQLLHLLPLNLFGQKISLTGKCWSQINIAAPTEIRMAPSLEVAKKAIDRYCKTLPV